MGGVRQFTLWLAVGGLITAPARAQDIRPCGGNAVPLQADGRLLNHFAYPVSARAAMVRPPASLDGQCELIGREMRDDLDALAKSARADPAIGRALVAVSCFRTVRHQARLFCRYGKFVSIYRQALEIAPPGFSEHSTGFAIDFGERGGRCRLTACFAETPTGQWLARHASSFGFEMSFPRGNRQGVAFEPWHWRWVGRGVNEQLPETKQVFAVARARFAGADLVQVPSYPAAAIGPFGPLVTRRVASEISFYASAATASAGTSLAFPNQSGPPKLGGPSSITTKEN